MEKTVREYVKEQVNLVTTFTSDYKHSVIRHAVLNEAERLAKEYIDQYNQGLITWAELGEQLVKIEKIKVAAITAINEQ